MVDQINQGKAPKQDNQMPEQPRKAKRELSSSAPGDERTPDKRIGQVAYADNSGKSQGGAGEPETSNLEPEKQGGIGGP